MPYTASVSVHDDLLKVVFEISREGEGLSVYSENVLSD